MQKVTDLFAVKPPSADMGLRNLAKAEILQIGNHLTGILSDRKINLDPPVIAIVGTQSAGKSSVVNRFLSREIAPTGKNMVTRTPVNYQMVNCADRNTVEFGDYIDGTWRATTKVDLNRADYIEQIRQEIERQTIQKAGASHGISHTPIIVKIFSPDVPTLSIIDLPGLTNVALVENGQPKDIVHQLRKMIGNYIQSERTLILLVMPARSDLEADQAFGLVKEFDPKGLRTIGVLTKADMPATDVSNYIEDKDVPESLRFKYGYYAVRNKLPDQKDVVLTPEQVTDQETTFFRNHEIYGRLLSLNRFGIGQLTHSLSEILTEHIKKSLPSLLSEITQLEMDLNKSLNLLGTSMPEKESDLNSMAYMLIANFCRTFTSALEERGSTLNYGRQLKDVFVTYRQNLLKTNYDFTDEMISNALTNCDGNHMLSLPSIEVLEYCLKKTKIGQAGHSPLNVFTSPSIEVLEKTTLLLSQLVDDVAKETNIDRFAVLTGVIKKELIGNIYSLYQNQCADNIRDLIKIEENYIWTDDAKFLEELQKLYQNLKPNKVDFNLIRVLISNYFNTVQRNLMDRVPKEIMFHFVTKTQTEVHNTLYDRVQKSGPVVKLLEESPQIAERRRKLVEQRNQVNAVKSIITSCQ